MNRIIRIIFFINFFINRFSLPETGGLEVFVLQHGVQTGTLFDVLVRGNPAIIIQIGTEVAVTEDDGFGIPLVQLFHEAAQ